METRELEEYENIVSLKRALKQSLGENIVFLISCTKKKMSYPATAEEMYSKSVVFRKKLLVASKIVPKSNIFVLSAKYGILHLKQKIKPYDVSLKNKKKEEKKKWGNRVLKQLKEIFNNNWHNNYYVVMAGKDYYEPLLGLNELKEKIILFFPKYFGNGKRHQYLNVLLSNAEKEEK